MSLEFKISTEIVKLDVNNAISIENSSDVKEEFQDEYYSDNKVCVSETTITDTFNISNSKLNEYIRNDEVRKYETLSLNHMKTDLPLSEVNDLVTNNVKIEDGICLSDIQIQCGIEQLFCNHCHEVYQDYCTKCRVLVHILNKSPSRNTYDRVRELPKYMLEAKESIGHLGIFSLKVIPEHVRLGPFTGIVSTRLPLRIKGGRFVVSNDKSEHLNWLQYINPARNIYEQNLLPFKYDDKLYYCSTRRIQEGEELLVYFGKEYEDNLLKNVEMDFVPITKKDVDNVFACTFCCLGFSSKEYLAEHKAVYHSETKEMFSVKELTQCQFCKVYLEAKEYFDYHMDYCCETNDRYSVLGSPEAHKREVDRQETKKWKNGIYKCPQCKFRTMYSADFRQHTNEHYEVKRYKCGICHRRYKTKESLKAHVENIHAGNEGRDVQKNTTCDYFKAITKNKKERAPHSHAEKQCQSSKCKFDARNKRHPKLQVQHLNRGKYKCANCAFKTYYRRNLARHMKIKHLMESSYKCSECEFETNYKSSLLGHVNAKHLKENNYKCTECEYKTNYKSNLHVHLKAKHLKENDFKCTECEFKTSYKSHLKEHVKTKHLKQKDYKCTECEYMVNRKSNLQKHIKAKHLKQKDYKCTECEHMTSRKADLEEHIKAIHLKQKDYKCMECEYMANRKSNLQIHIETKHLKQKAYECTQCEFKTNYKSSLEAHVKAKHLKQKDYNCVECEYKTNYRKDLRKHINAKHIKENYYKCTECEHMASRKLDLEEHMTAKHLKHKDYKCTECQYMAKHKSNLQIHIEIKHLKRKPHECTKCEFKTNYKASLETHIKTKHLKQMDYKCMECEYKTNYKKDLGKHIKAVHLKIRDYKCTECELMTSRKSDLEEHVKAIHLKQKNYKCEECKYMSNRKSNLKAHVKAKHLKEIDHKCMICEFKTNYKSNLERHMKEKHLKLNDFKIDLNAHVKTETS